MSYTAKSNVIFGSIDLSDYNAFAFYCNIFEKPERDVETISVPGRNGDLLFDNGRYKNVDRIYRIQCTGLTNIQNLLSALTAEIGYQILTDDYEPDYYFRARVKGSPKINRFSEESVDITLTFDRVPQKFLSEGKISYSGRLYSTAESVILVRNTTLENFYPIITFTVSAATGLTTSAIVFTSDRSYYGMDLNLAFSGLPVGSYTIDGESKVVYNTITKEDARGYLTGSRKTYPLIYPDYLYPPRYSSSNKSVMRVSDSNNTNLEMTVETGGYTL